MSTASRTGQQCAQLKCLVYVTKLPCLTWHFTIYVYQLKNLCAEEEKNLINKKILLRNKEQDLLNLEKINEVLLL